MWTNRRGQAAAEYAVLAAVVAAVLIGMQIYLKRGLSGRIRGAADSIGAQYAPKDTTYSYTTTVSGTTTTEAKLLKNQPIDDQGNLGSLIETTTTIERPGEVTTRTGSETVGALSGKKLWD